MIYTRIEWIWTDKGLKETFVESCEYEGEFMMCGGGDSGGGGGDSDDSDRNNKPFNPSADPATQPRDSNTGNLNQTPNYDDDGDESESSTANIQQQLNAAQNNLTPQQEAESHNTNSIQFETRPEVILAYNNLNRNTGGTSGEGTGSATTTTATASTTGDDESEVTEEEPLSTFVDDEALRKTRRRLRDRFGRRATRGGGAETVGTGYSLGG